MHCFTLLSASYMRRNTRYTAPFCLLAVETQHEVLSKSPNCLWTEVVFPGLDTGRKTISIYLETYYSSREKNDTQKEHLNI